MKVPHLNEFLRRAIKEEILGSLLIDFRSATSSFCDRRIVYADIPGVAERITFFGVDGRPGTYSWDLAASSMEILSIALSSGVNNKKVIIHLGRACSSTGTPRS